MGIFDLFKAAGGGAQANHLGPVRSPWSSQTLRSVVLADALGLTANATVSRSVAMQVPAIAKGRAIICGVLARLPLLGMNDGIALPVQPAWLGHTDTSMSPQQRMIWTLDDLIFNGASLWALSRDPDGQIIDAIRVRSDQWTIDPDTGTVSVQGTVPAAKDICLFEGPQEGLTTIAADTITGARAIDDAWIKRIKSPIPTQELHLTDANTQLTQDEINEFVESWEQARRDGGTAFTPNDLELRTHGEASADLFIAGRNALRLDIANFLNLPASILEGSTAASTLTYSTAAGKRNELADYSLAYWASAIEARLSMDDISDPGVYVQFDMSSLAVADGPTLED